MTADPHALVWQSLAPYLAREGGDVKRAMSFLLADLRTFADQVALDWAKVCADGAAQYELIRDFGKYRNGSAGKEAK